MEDIPNEISSTHLIGVHNILLENDFVYRVWKELNEIINNDELNYIYNKKITDCKYYKLSDNGFFRVQHKREHFSITDIVLVTPSLHDLDKISIEMTIGGCGINKIDNLLVFVMLNKKIKFIDNLYHIH